MKPIAPSSYSGPFLETKHVSSIARNSKLQSNTKQFTCKCMIIIITIVYLAGQSVSNWGAWGECSEDCDGEQTRTRKCIESTSCGTLEDKRECSTNWCLSKYHLQKMGGISRASTLFLFNEG